MRNTLESASLTSDLMMGNDINVVAILYPSMPRGDTVVNIGCINCVGRAIGGVKSLLTFFFFFDFFELDVVVLVVAGNAGLRETSILSAEIAPPSSVPCRARCVRNELRSANSLPHIKQRKNALG